MALIHEFVSLYPTKAEALKQLNVILESNYKSNRLYEWLDTKNPCNLPTKAANALRRYMLDFLLAEKGVNLSEKELNDLLDKLI